MLQQDGNFTVPDRLSVGRDFKQQALKLRCDTVQHYQRTWLGAILNRAQGQTPAYAVIET
jgi:hypothetical protein